MFEAAAEYRIHDRFGVGIFAGAGVQSLSRDSKHAAFLFGPQVFAYPFGDFHRGLRLTAEFGYMAVAPRVVYRYDGSPFGTEQLEVSGREFYPALLAGYKYETTFRLTFHAELGVRYAVSTVTVSNGSSEGSATERDWLPMLRLGVGASF
jgi:hypothetical protein